VTPKESLSQRLEMEIKGTELTLRCIIIHTELHFSSELSILWSRRGAYRRKTIRDEEYDQVLEYLVGNIKIQLARLKVEAKYDKYKFQMQQ
jgi:hypothetical protein